MKIAILIRLPRENKSYWENQLQEFADRFDTSKITEVQYGKQDLRGTESITLHDKKNCVPYQKHFKNKDEMLGYVEGFNQAWEKHDSFGRYID